MGITSGLIAARGTTQRLLEEARDAVEEVDGAELDESPVLLLPSPSTFSGDLSWGASSWGDSWDRLVSEIEDDAEVWQSTFLAAVAPDSVGLAPDWLAPDRLVPVKDDAAEVSADVSMLGSLNLYLHPSLRMTMPRSARRSSAVVTRSLLSLSKPPLYFLWRCRRIWAKLAPLPLSRSVCTAYCNSSKWLGGGPCGFSGFLGTRFGTLSFLFFFCCPAGFGRFGPRRGAFLTLSRGANRRVRFIFPKKQFRCGSSSFSYWHIPFLNWLTSVFSKWLFSWSRYTLSRPDAASSLQPN